MKENIKTMRHCSWTKICTSLWRFGLQPSNFFHFPPQGSEDPILVKLALMAEKPKLHKENLLSYDFSNTRLQPSNRNFASLYKLAILQPKHFSHSRALQLHSATRLRYHKHHVRATRSSRKSDNFPNACGFRWWCEIWVSHQSGSFLSWGTWSHLHLVAATALSLLTATASPAAVRAYCTTLCSRRGKMLSRLSRTISSSQK